MTYPLQEFSLEKTMNIFEEATNKTINLTDKDFLSSGGEGDIYIKDNKAFKIYHEKSKVIPLKKIEELRALEHPNIIKPESPLFDKHKNLIGYSMKYIKDSFSLSRLITNDFRNQHHIENEDILNIAKQIIDITKYIHQKKCFIVDGNEMNYIVSKDFKHVYFIDVDSYQTPSFKPTAYSPSTLDPNSDKKHFNEFTDWFSIGIVLCNLLIGIHPFKGKYKGTEYNFGKNDFQERMKHKISVFNEHVKVNSAVRDFSIIPINLQSWFYRLFEKGERLSPPETFGKVNIKFEKQRLENSDVINIEEIADFQHEILDIFNFENNVSVKTKKHFYYDGIKIPYSKSETEFIYHKKENNGYLIKSKNNILQLYDKRKKEIVNTNVYSEFFFVKDNILFVFDGRKIYSCNLIITKSGLNIVPDIVFNLSGKHLKHIDNVLFMEFPENFLFILPIGNKLHTIYSKIFKERAIINARMEENGLQVIYKSQNNYYCGFYIIDETTNSLITLFEKETDYLDINFCKVKNLFVCIFEDEKINLLTLDHKKNVKERVIKEKNIKTEHILKRVNHEVHTIDGNTQKKISLS
jgi:serine/threonine protein kinase